MAHEITCDLCGKEILADSIDILLIMERADTSDVFLKIEQDICSMCRTSLAKAIRKLYNDMSKRSLNVN